ncbi:uncharacterized protein LOC105697322 isoform X2 [Orussus abietinus]|uniref:uncharacterized protein LOC105697322 isoform X2 n=1 Tax=Orussus abietinus TaxID=222816 RepID=UPI000625596E|nr:uncharacterized protein LOC105697322 isoform X2 [Orussus abietinus]
MGNGGSSHRQSASGSLSSEVGRGWTHSFPRELARRHSQLPGRKVLPEPPNQRLRVTDNGSIIHNGGTISGRRPSALTLPHDLDKNAFRGRSTSASSFGAGRSRCCQYRECAKVPDLKRFGSEPDLRHAPVEAGRAEPHHRGPQVCRPERDSRERESRYRGKKKYKAPPPPASTSLANGEPTATGSSPDSYHWEMGQDSRRTAEAAQPPPRRSRLFKTRAETKRALVNWPSPSQDRDALPDGGGKRRRRPSKEKSGPPPRRETWREHEDERKREERRSKILDGKNTLQRSLSSPEFQAELMRVARKVRTKMSRATGRESPVGEASSRVDARVRVGRTREEERPGEPSSVEARRRNGPRARHRGQGSGRESTPEPTRNHGEGEAEARSARRKAEPAAVEPEPIAPRGRLCAAGNRETSTSTEKPAPKTFYFGMNEPQPSRSSGGMPSRNLDDSHPEAPSVDVDEDLQKREEPGIEDIALKLRPTLPKKQLEIPRFSPSAAWRLLSALETPGPAMSTASEEVPVLFEERIERLSRAPPPLMALGPRSSHDKSGDSGISGDAGAGNEDLLDVGTSGRSKAPTRPAWTPQQDLGEESSSDAGVDSPPPTATPLKFPPRAHVFSLSLPRDDNRLSLYSADAKAKETTSFNSLQKLKRSVSGALGLGPIDPEKRRSADALDDNWLLSTSAPTSLQHNSGNAEGTAAATAASSPGWEPESSPREDDVDCGDGEDDDEDIGVYDEEPLEERTEFPVLMRPPSFSYLASGGHVMYLPEANGTGYQPRSLNYRPFAGEIDKPFDESAPRFRKNAEEGKKVAKFPCGMTQGGGQNGESDSKRGDRLAGAFRERPLTELGHRSRQLTTFSKSCENVSEMRQRGRSPSPGPENLQDAKETSVEAKVPAKQNSRSRRFTFQSTVRQIERRRLAERLSREAEAKERQRKGELEAMRKVEEEFQRKRAREKASIRQQLRLFSMDENLNSNSLPPVWNNSQVPRADPDGAPSSSASSPTSAVPAKTDRKNSVSSDEYHRKSTLDARQHHRHHQQQQHQQQANREYKDYRPRYYDWVPENSSHPEFKHTTVHPKVVYDIPKSSPVYVEANLHAGKPANPTSTPRSDNYRKDFAHGAVAARSSLASSDSELSQPNTRPHSRQAENKSKRRLRSRSASPERSEDVASSEEEAPVEAVERERDPRNGFPLNGIQPFVREKSYRPISFDPQPPPPIPS